MYSIIPIESSHRNNGRLDKFVVQRANSWCVPSGLSCARLDVPLVDKYIAQPIFSFRNLPSQGRESFSLPSHPYTLGTAIRACPLLGCYHIIWLFNKTRVANLPARTELANNRYHPFRHNKKQFHQQTRSAKREHSRSATLPDTKSTMSGDENTTLLQADQGKKPLWKDDRPYVRWPANICRLTWLILASSYINVLLVFVPLGTIARALSWNPTAIFVLNFLAIVPLASLLTFAVEELSAKLGQTWRGLLNAMFSNAVKLIVS